MRYRDAAPNSMMNDYEKWLKLFNKRQSDIDTYGREGHWNPKKGEYTSPSGALFIFEDLKSTRYEP